jgi:hypothetical protein
VANALKSRAWRAQIEPIPALRQAALKVVTTVKIPLGLALCQVKSPFFSEFYKRLVKLGLQRENRAFSE